MPFGSEHPAHDRPFAVPECPPQCGRLAKQQPSEREPRSLLTGPTRCRWAMPSKMAVQYFCF
jgi:hypothetical protein